MTEDSNKTGKVAPRKVDRGIKPISQPVIYIASASFACAPKPSISHFELAIRRSTMKCSENRKAVEFAASTATEYHQLLHSYLRRRLRRPADLDDLAQEVYLRLVRIKDEDVLARVREPMAYIYGIAANVLADWNRASDRCIDRSTSLDAADYDHLLEADPDISDDPAERVALQQYVESVLAQLPPIQAAVLLLHARDGLSYQEISRTLNVGIEMVHYHLKRAKARIRLTPGEK